MSTVKGSLTLKEALCNDANKIGHRLQGDASSVEYVSINNLFAEKKRASCQTEEINIIPNCAHYLEELL